MKKHKNIKKKTLQRACTNKSRNQLTRKSCMQHSMKPHIHTGRMSAPRIFKKSIDIFTKHIYTHVCVYMCV